MFTDLVSSTELFAALGAADASRFAARHFAGLRDALGVHRGGEVKTLGDGLMAGFDSVADAIDCAVTMQRAVEGHNRQLPAHRVAMRVGISTGEATVTDGDYFGPPVVEASRLCAAAGPGGILIADVTRILAGTTRQRLEPAGALPLKGLNAATIAWRVEWDADEESGLRVALVDDSALLRQGIAAALRSEGIEVVLEAADAGELLGRLELARPHVVVVDVRMPPTHTTEGLDAAREIKRRLPKIGVLVLSASIDAGAACRLLREVSDGIGYLLKERVADVGELTAAIRTVAGGGTAIDPEVLAGLAGGAALRLAGR
jgi:class 3 adenylate cyclase/CheY-like chemotaxis protein